MIMSSQSPIPYRTSFNGKLDRLSTLIERLRVQVSYAAETEPRGQDANLLVFADRNVNKRLVFHPNGAGVSNGIGRTMTGPGETVAAAARIEVSGVGSKLVQALPERIEVDLSKEPYLTAVVDPLIEEVAYPRCGGQAVFERLCEVVVIRLLRHALESGATDEGLLSGLAHPRISAALVALHERPADPWTLERLAETAAMSRTQFAVTFKSVVGQTPMGYLSHWRLEVARAELDAGKPVKSVARTCGFSSPAAFSRAFARQFGYSPKQGKHAAA